MEITQNIFNKGLNTDIDEYLITADTLRYSMNIRLNNISDNSFILTNVEGNEELFSLSRGFVPIGTVTDNSFTYIFSFNPLTKEGEIGTYPSLNYNELPPIFNASVEPFYPYSLYPENHTRNITNTENDVLQIVNVYKPLFNLVNTSNNRINNRITEWGFSLETPIVREVVSKLNFDYSYNLYWTDNNNPPKVLNGSISFYNGEYKLSKKTYTKEDVLGEINLIPTSRVLSKVSNINVLQTGGRLLTGNYTFYLIYNENGIKTIPQCNTNKVSIYFTKNNINYGGTESISTTTDVTPIDNLRTTNSVNIQFDLDTSFSSYRIWVEHNKGEDIAISTFEEIDIDYSTANPNFIYTGFERTIPITETEINSIYYNVSKVKTLTQLDSRLFMGNIKTFDYNIDNLRKLALQFTLGWEVIDMNVTNMPYLRYSDVNLPLGDENNIGYSHWKNIYDKLGYWGEEQYAFGIVFKLKNGDETQAFPMQGADFSINPMGTNANNLGIIKMPQRQVTGLYDVVSPNKTFKIIGVKLTFTKLNVNNTLLEDIIGYKIVRADRNKNIITQGYGYSGALMLNGTNDLGQDWEGNQLGNVFNPQDVRLKTIPAPSGLLQCEGWRDSTDADVFCDPVDVMLNTNKLDETRITFYSNDVELDRITWDTMDNYEAFVRVIAQPEGDNIAFKGVYNYPQPKNYWNHMLFYPNQLRFTNPLGNNVSKYKLWKVDTGRDVVNGKFSSNIERVGQSWFGDRFFVNMKHRFTKYTGLQWVSNSKFITSRWTYVTFGFGVRPYRRLSGFDGVAGNLLGRSLNESLLLNIYKIDPFTDYLSFYNTPTILQYKPITNWTEFTNDYILKPLELPTLTLPTIFNGDCYVGFGFKKLWYSSIKNENTYPIAGNNTEENGRTGLILQMISENNFNPHFRELEVVNISDNSNLEVLVNKRSYYPLAGYFEPSNLTYTGNLVRLGYSESETGLISGQLLSHSKVYALPDSNASNKGYSVNLPIKRYTLNDRTLPFESISFPTRIVYSEQQTSLSFKDSYRDIKPLNSQDYDLTKGEIIDIENLNSSLIATQEKSISIIPYKERVPLNQGSQVFISGTGVLTPYNQSIANFGSQHTHSIIKTDRTVYGTDINRRKIWQINGNDVKAISDFIIESYLCKDEVLNYLDRFSFYHNKTDIINNIGVRVGYDNFNQEVLFTYYLKGNEQVSFTVVYSEILGVWTSFYSMTPSLYWNRGNNLLSFNNEDYNKNNEQKAFIHNRQNRNTFYNEFTNSEVEIIINPNTESSKVYDNHSIISNNIYPSKAKWTTENQEAERTREWLLQMRRLRQEENRVQLVVGSSEVDKREEYNHNRQNSRIRDKYVKLRLTYDTKKELRIQRILTKYRRSFN